jgi:hypothetical protein
LLPLEVFPPKESLVLLTLRQGSARTERLDRVVWRAGFSLDAHGMLIGLRASHTAVLPELRRVIPPGARLSTAGVVDSLYSLVIGEDDGRVHTLYEDAECAERSADLDELVIAFRSRLHLKVAAGARTRLFVHAGVVGWQRGAIVIPGRTHSGKSSLVAALVAAGATYYSDEYAVLDDAGLVHPFARPLGIRDETGRTRHVDPDSIGAAIGDTPLPIRLVIATQYAFGAEWRPKRLSPGETVLALLENTVAVRSRPADTLKTLATAVRDTEALSSLRGDATSLAEQLLARTTTPTR